MPTLSTQLPLRLGSPSDQRFDTFVGAAPATALLSAVAAGSDLAAVYITGSSGSGKTHLLLATCHHAHTLGQRTAYLPLASVAGQLTNALEALEQADLVALDGVQAVVGQRTDEIALFDLHNRLLDAGKRLCYSASAAPDAWPGLLPDLRSRLNHCTRLTLSPLDDAGRAEVLRQRAARRGLQVEPAAIDWLLRRCGRNLTHLSAILDQLDRASLAEQRRVTVPFLRRHVVG